MRLDLRHNVARGGQTLIGQGVMKIVIRLRPTKYGARLRFPAVRQQMLAKDCARPVSKRSLIRCTR